MGKSPGHRLPPRPVVGRAADAWRRQIARDLAALRRIARTVGDGRREAAIMAAAYGVYGLVRGLWGGTLEEGRANASSLIGLERDLGIWVEPAWQRFVTENGLGMPAWSAFYLLSQVIVLPLTLILVHRYRRSAYAFLRNMALLSWSAGLVWYALQPVAPPRLMPGWGLTDTVSAQTPVALDSDLIRMLYNPVAAMPSLHVGMAPVVAWALWTLTTRWWSRLLGLAYPVLVSISVVVTGNHYLLDIAGGVAVVLPAAAIAAWLAREPVREARPPAGSPPSDASGRPPRGG